MTYRIYNRDGDLIARTEDRRSYLEALERIYNDMDPEDLAGRYEAWARLRGPGAPCHTCERAPCDCHRP